MITNRNDDKKKGEKTGCQAKRKEGYKINVKNTKN